MKKIILIRHATPNVNYDKCGWQEARYRLRDYDITSNIALGEVEHYLKQPQSYLLNCIKLDRIICSPLIRAEKTCQAMFKGRKYEVNYYLKEAENEIGEIPFIKLKLKHWFMINRLNWLVGLNTPAIEPKKDFLNRVNKIGLEIESATGNVAIVSHGIFLHYLRGKLSKRNGYSVVDYYKDGCFTVEILEKTQ